MERLWQHSELHSPASKPLPRHSNAFYTPCGSYRVGSHRKHGPSCEAPIGSSKSLFHYYNSLLATSIGLFCAHLRQKASKLRLQRQRHYCQAGLLSLRSEVLLGECALFAFSVIALPTYFAVTPELAPLIPTTRSACWWLSVVLAYVLSSFLAELTATAWSTVMT